MQVMHGATFPVHLGESRGRDVAVAAVADWIQVFGAISDPKIIEKSFKEHPLVE